jgi:hypothetical protein
MTFTDDELELVEEENDRWMVAFLSTTSRFADLDAELQLGSQVADMATMKVFGPMPKAAAEIVRDRLKAAPLPGRKFKVWMAPEYQVRHTQAERAKRRRSYKPVLTEVLS